MAIPIDDFISATQEARSYLSRYEAALAEFKQTGEFMGAKHNVVVGQGAQPRDWTRANIASYIEETGTGGTVDDFIEKNISNQKLDSRLDELKADLGKAGFREERKRMRIAQNVTDVEDFTDEEWERLVRRNAELNPNYIPAGTRPAEIMRVNSDKTFENVKIFKQHEILIPGTNERLAYAVQAGAPELIGGHIDPEMTIGSDRKIGGAHNTKGANQGQVSLARGKYKSSKETLEKLKSSGEEVKAQEELVYKQERMLKLVTRHDSNVSSVGKMAIEDALFQSAARPYEVSSGYFGRVDWGEHAVKSVNETADLALDLGRSTGGRGTAWLVRGVEDFTVSSSEFIAGDGRETPILGKHKPIAGLSSRGHESVLRQTAGPGSGVEVGIGETVDDILKRGASGNRYFEDVYLAWAEETIAKDSAKVASGEIPLSKILGERASEIAGIKSSDEIGGSMPTSSKPFSQVAATMEKAESLEASGKIARNNIAMTVDDGVELTVRRSSSTARMLGSAADASAAVAKGIPGSNTLRAAGAALNILT
jgi:hypothetical protein